MTNPEEFYGPEGNSQLSRAEMFESHQYFHDLQKIHIDNQVINGFRPDTEQMDLSGDTHNAINDAINWMMTRYEDFDFDLLEPNSYHEIRDKNGYINQVYFDVYNEYGQLVRRELCQLENHGSLEPQVRIELFHWENNTGNQICLMTVWQHTNQGFGKVPLELVFEDIKTQEIFYDNVFPEENATIVWRGKRDHPQLVKRDYQVSQIDPEYDITGTTTYQHTPDGEFEPLSNRVDIKHYSFENPTTTEIVLYRHNSTPERIYSRTTEQDLTDNPTVLSLSYSIITANESLADMSTVTQLMMRNAVNRECGFNDEGFTIQNLTMTHLENGNKLVELTNQESTQRLAVPSIDALHYAKSVLKAEGDTHFYSDIFVLPDDSKNNQTSQAISLIQSSEKDLEIMHVPDHSVDTLFPYGIEVDEYQIDAIQKAYLTYASGLKLSDWNFLDTGSKIIGYSLQTESGCHRLVEYTISKPEFEQIFESIETIDLTPQSVAIHAFQSGEMFYDPKDYLLIKLGNPGILLWVVSPKKSGYNYEFIYSTPQQVDELDNWSSVKIPQVDWKQLCRVIKVDYDNYNEFEVIYSGENYYLMAREIDSEEHLIYQFKLSELHSGLAEQFSQFIESQNDIDDVPSKVTNKRKDHQNGFSVN